METNTQKTLNYAGAIIIILLMIGLGFTLVKNSKGKKSLYAEKETSEKLLSEKLAIEKELAKLQEDFLTLKQKYDENQKLLAETDIKIANSQKRINTLTSENRSLKEATKELEDLRKIKSDLEKESALLKSDYNKLMLQNKDLQDSLSALENEKKNLTLQLEQIRMHNTDNFKVTATRGKKTEKLVVLASRTKKLNISFEVPSNLTEAISFKIVTPSGTTINPDDKAISWHSPLDIRNFTASLSAVSGEFEQSREVILNYVSKTKLVKGEYKIEILSNGVNIGNCRLMLR